MCSIDKKYIIRITDICLYNQFGCGKNKWTTLTHNGVMFPPEYKPHGVPLLYKGEKIVLDKESEEIATMYAKYIETEYVNNRIFRSNFWHDWKKVLNNKYPIESLEGCDFSLIYEHILKEMEKTKGEPEKKAQRDEAEKKHKTAIVDGKEQPVGNFRIEPPGIFIGRGCNPKLGKIKRRIYPEDIIINIGKESQIPQPLDGHKWKKVVHDKTSEWLASWRDNITGKLKYVWLGAHSDVKIKGDVHKFDLARKLKKRIRGIMEENYKNLSSDNLITRQIATALYLIDKLALRVGNEKGEDEADTVGITSLRFEHMLILDDNKITLDFLGKDSVRYLNTVQVDSIAHKNLKEFTGGKGKHDSIFDSINANDINKYLQSFMKGLTAKVFRTYNASNLFQKELKKITNKYATYDKLDKINILLNEFNSANAKVALLCNHQKNISKSFKESVEKIDMQIKELKNKLTKAKRATKKNTSTISKIKERIMKLKTKKNLKIQLKNVSLGTSKVNYIDPRITVAFLKKHNLSIDKVF
jgi:DNA topoisomerase-1